MTEGGKVKREGWDDLRCHSKPISRSADLQRLQNEGYDLEIRSGFLLGEGRAVREFPQGSSSAECSSMKLVLAGDKTARPDDHVAYFVGEHPCRADGTEIAQIKH